MTYVKERPDGFAVADDSYEVFCECSRPGCVERLAVPAEVYDRIRSDARIYLVRSGHEVRGELPNDLGALSRGADVLVFYMALRQAAVLAARLIEAGRSPEEAVAFVSNATTASQRVHEATLRDAGDVAAMLDPHAPTLVVIGPVVALRAMVAPYLAADPMRVLAPSTQLSATGLPR